MPRVPLCVVFACVVGGLASPARGEDPAPTVLRTFDLGFLEDVEGRPAEGGLGLWWTAPTISDDEDLALAAPLAPDDLVALLRETVHPQLWEDADAATLRLEATHLVVRAPAAVVADVAAVVDAMWRRVAQRVRLTAHVLAGPGDALDRVEPAGLREALSRGRLDPAQRDALLAHAAGHSLAGATVSTEVRPGAWARLKHTRNARWLLDYDVEIAQDSVVGNPIVIDGDLGWALDLRALRLPDEGWSLDLLVQIAEPVGSVREVEPGAAPFGSLDFPSLRVLRLSSGARLAAGETLVLLSREGDDLRLVLLDAAPSGPEPKPLPMTPLDVTALTAPRWGLTPTEEHLASAAVLRPDRRLVMGPASGGAPGAQEFLDLLPASAPAGGRRATDTTLWVEPAAADEALATLAALSADLLATERLEVRWLETPPEGPTRERARIAIDLPRGQTFAVEHALERTFLADWDVEVAQEARAGDPIPGVLRSGIFLDGLLSAPSGDEAPLLTLDSLLTAQQGAFETLQPDNACTGVIERAVLDSLRATHDGPLAAGQPVRVELGRDAAGTTRVLELRLWR